MWYWNKDGTKILYPVYYASEDVNEALKNYTMTLQELLSLVFAFEKFRSYLLGTRVIVHTDYSSFRHLMAKKNDKPRLIYLALLLQEFDIEVKDTNGQKIMLLTTCPNKKIKQ